jgi:hypothetical protein
LEHDGAAKSIKTKTVANFMAGSDKALGCAVSPKARLRPAADVELTAACRLTERVR